MSKPYSLWDAANFGLTVKGWAAFPEIGASSLRPHLSPFADTELIIGFPTLLASPSRIRSYAKGGEALPPLPTEGESSSERGRPAAAFGRPANTGKAHALLFRIPLPLIKVFFGKVRLRISLAALQPRTAQFRN